jgi:hypothetical protein
MRKRLHDWEALIAELEVSGLSRAEFCRRRKLKYQTMSKWISRQSQSPVTSKRVTADKSRSGGQVGLRRAPNVSARFAEIPIQLRAAIHTYEIVLGTGRSIRVPAAFDADAVARLIQAVESC